MDDTIYPTHTAFDDALEIIIWLMQHGGREDVKSGRLLIVHAIICPYGLDISQAWIERDGKIVIFTGILRGEKVMINVDRDEYYINSKVRDVTRYTLFEAYAEELRTGHYGPWLEKYRVLCNDIKK